MPTFDILGPIHNIETFAVGSQIRDIARLRKVYGQGRWRKRKGVAKIRWPDGSLATAETNPLMILGYEASGIGRREFKVKYLID